MRRGILAAGVVLASGMAAHAQVVMLQASQDTSIYANSGTLSNGSGPTIIAGQTATAQERRGLIAFDVAGQIPAGSVITGVSLTLNVIETGPAPSVSFALHRLLADWGEGASHAGPFGGSGAPALPGDATWTHRLYPGTMWAMPGGDTAASPSAVQMLMGPGSYNWSSAAMAADVQSWLDNSGSNHGWMLIGQAVAGSARRFDSRESENPQARPMLHVTYIPAPGWAGLAAAGGVVASRRRRC